MRISTHSAEKLKTWTLWDFLTTISLRNIKTKLKGPFRDKKIQKSVTVLKKVNVRTLQARPVSQIHKRILAEAGTGTRDRWVPPKPKKVYTKKWYTQGELCGLTKKVATVIVGHFC